MKASLLILSLSLSLAACTNSSSTNNSGGGSGIPGNLPQRPVVAANPLSAGQEAQLTAFFARMPSIPESELLSAPAQETADEKKEREEKIAKLSKKKKDMFNQLVGKCAVTIDKKEIENLNVGAVGNGYKNVTVSGDDCLVTTTERSTETRKMIESNLTAIQEEYKNTGDIKVYDRLIQKFDMENTSNNETLLKEELIATSGISRHFVGMNMTAKVEVVGQKYKMHAIATGSMSVLETNGQTSDVKMTIEMLLGNEQKENYFEMDMNIQGIKVKLQNYGKDKDSKLYMNGVLLTEEKAKQIFGEDFSMKSDDDN